jgi:hypothetical protein
VGADRLAQIGRWDGGSGDDEKSTRHSFQTISRSETGETPSPIGCCFYGVRLFRRKLVHGHTHTPVHLDLEHRPPYALRHTYASFSIAAGASLFALARRMGTSVQQIDKTYGHLLPDAAEYERGLLDAFDADQASDVGVGAR